MERGYLAYLHVVTGLFGLKGVREYLTKTRKDPEFLRMYPCVMEGTCTALSHLLAEHLQQFYPRFSHFQLHVRAWGFLLRMYLHMVGLGIFTLPFHKDLALGAAFSAKALPEEPLPQEESQSSPRLVEETSLTLASVTLAEDGQGE